MSRLLALAREALAASISQPVASVVTIVIVAGMCATVLLTTGRTVGAEQAVLGTIDSAGTRSIVIRATPDAGLDTHVLDRISSIEGVEWAVGFGNAIDIENVATPGGPRVPLRPSWSTSWSRLGIPETMPVANKTAWASRSAVVELGAIDAVGGLVSREGIDFALAGRFDVPEYLAFLEPLVVVPQLRTASPQPIGVLVVVASSPELVAPVAAAVQSVLGLYEPTKASISTSEQLAALRSLVQGQLGSFGRALVLIIFALTATLVAAILFGLVMLRRKDFGRRRALGASQGLIVGLLTMQVALLSAIGAVVGTFVAILTLTVSGDPLPGIAFVIAVDILALAVGVLAALIPATAAARRDPLVELRIP